MYRPTKLTIKNLLSHKLTEYKFIDGQAILVTGENLDDDGQESNGAGKSGLIEGISIAITGKPLRTVKDCDLVLYGEDDALIEMELQNDILKEHLTITRELFTKKSKSATLKIVINEDDQKKHYPGVREGNQWLLDKIGISREDLINYYVVSKSKSISFFSQSNTEKEKVISRFSGTESLMPIREEIKADIKFLEGNKEIIESKIVKLQGKAEAYQEQLEMASTVEQEELKRARIQKREQDVDIANSQHAQANVKIVDLKKSYVKLKADFDELLLSGYSGTNVDYSIQLRENEILAKENQNDIQAKVKELNENEAQANEFKSFKSEIERNIADSIKCPKCSHTFIIRDEEYDVESAKAQLPEIDGMLEHFSDEDKRIKSEGADLKEIKNIIIAEENNIRNSIRKQDADKLAFDRKLSQDEIKVVNAHEEIGEWEKRAQRYLDTAKELEQEIKGIKAEVIEDPSLEITKTIKSNNDAIIDLEKELDESKEKYVKMKEFEVIFTKFITHLSNKAVKSIEKLTNDYLGNMGSNLAIDIEGYKVNADGSIKQKLTTIVSRDGIPEAFLDNYSEGEKSRIIIAGTLALNSLLNMSCTYGKGLGFIVLDELMGSLDRLGVQSVIEALGSLSQTILAISHVEPRNQYQYTVKIIKENGYSRVD